MSKVLEDLLYSPSHEWLKVEGNIAYVGVTDFAQESLGSVVYVESAEVDEEVKQFEEAGAIESVKAASDINSPASGKVIEVNEDVIDNPELINNDPYENWIYKMELADVDELNNLLDKAKYEELIKNNH